MNIFTATMSKNTSCNCHPEWDDRHRIICAETQAHALGLILQAESDTCAKDWTIEQVDTSSYGITYF